MPLYNNEALDDPLLFERDETFRGGVDEYQRPTLLQPGQYARGKNTVLFDNHEQGTRPGWLALGAFGESGTVQGCGYFDTVTAGGEIQRLLAARNGVVKMWDGATWTTVTGYTPTGSLFMAQGIGTLLVTDGALNLRSFDGTGFTDLGDGGAASNPPKGVTVLCWHANRMFASGYPGNQTYSGDTYTNDTVWVSDALAFGAGDWDWADWSFRVGTGDGEAITALAPAQNFNLVVFKAGSVWLVNTNPALHGASPTAADFTIQLLAAGAGCVGRRAWCYAGNDILFLSQDGVRQVGRMAAAAGQYEVTAPLSQPMQPYIDRINWERAGGIVAQNYRHYALFWVPLDTSETNNYCLVFNTRLGVWVGYWTGPTATAACVTRFDDQLRLVMGDTDGNLNEWQDYRDQLLPASVMDNGADYATTIRVRSTQHGEPVNDKDGYYFEARLRDVTNPVSVDMVVDEQLAATYTLTPPTGAIMGQVSLPFNLAPDSMITARKSLDGLPPHNESYLEFTSERGRFTIKNVTRAAFLNTLQNE